jgi:hypothetical protein
MGSAGPGQSFPSEITAVSDTAWELLTADTNTFVDISVLVTTSDQSTMAVPPRYVTEEPVDPPDGPDRAVTVASTHTASWGETLAAFSITWTHGQALTTEYNAGLSIFHDVKDHRLYGLGITPLTEIQTLVQTLYGRACAESGGAAPDPHTWRPALYAAIHDELFGPRGPRVYDPRARALLSQHVPEASQQERTDALRCMWLIATQLMLPPLARLYAEHDVARELQRPLRQQGTLVRRILSDVRWADHECLLLRLDDNVGLTQTVRAPVNADLREVSTTIADEVRTYIQAEQLDHTFGAIFDWAGYLIPSRRAASQ